MQADESQQIEGRPNSHAACVVISSHWPAVYAYVRASGQTSGSALDITRRLIGELAVNRRLITVNHDDARSVREMGAKVTVKFMETCRRGKGPEFVSHYAAVPGLLDIDRAEASYLDGCESPEQAFGVGWGRSIIQSALTQVRDRCIRLRMEPEWVAFERRVVRPLLTDQPASPFSRLRTIVPNRHTAEIMLAVATLKRWFAHAINVEVHRTVVRKDYALRELRILARIMESAPDGKRRMPLASPFFWAMQMSDNPAPALADWLLAEATGQNQRFDAFLSDSRTSVEDLENAKYLFKVMRSDGERTEDRALARHAYLGAIAAGLANHGRLLSEQSVAALAEAFEQMVDSEELPECLQSLAGQALCQLRAGVGDPDV